MRLSLLKIFSGLLIFFAAFSAGFAQETATQNQVQNQTEQRQSAETFGENDRLPFMQTTDSPANNEPSSGGLLIKTLGAMFLIVGLIFFGAWGLKKLGFGNFKTAAAEDAPDLTILTSISLGSGRTISTVRFGDRTLLVGSTAQSFTLLAEDAENEFLSETDKPRSVAEMLAAESEISFADELAEAEMNLSDWTVNGGRS